MNSESSDASCRKPPLSPRPQSASPKPSLYPSLIDCEPPASIRAPLATSQGNKRSSKTSDKCSKQRVRSASAGRSPRHDLQARYWALLFENLHRAVDEIYQTCETDESVAECKEAVLMLENYAQEFRSLITWLRLSKDLERTPPPNRPTSLAWEVRKSSPGKGALKHIFWSYINSGGGQWPPNCGGKVSPCISTGIQTERVPTSSGTKATGTTVESNTVLKESCDDADSITLLSPSNPENNSTDDHIKSLSAPAEVSPVSDQSEPSAFEETIAFNENEAAAPDHADITFKETEAARHADTEFNETEAVGHADIAFNETEAAGHSDIAFDQEKTADLDIKNEISKDNLVLCTKPDEVIVCSTTPEEVSVSTELNAAGNNDKATSEESVKIHSTTLDLTTPENKTVKDSLPLTSQSQSATLCPSPCSISSTTSINTSTRSSCQSTNVLLKTVSVSNTVTSTGTASRSWGTSKPSPAVTNTLSCHASKCTSSSNRVGSNTFRTATNSYRSSYHSKVPNDSRRGFLERRSGVYRGSSTTSISARDVEKKPYGSARVPSVTSASTANMGKLTKDHQKTGSTSSVSSTSSGQSWADKVKGTAAVDKNATNKLKNEEEDNEGWETVHRGRTRSRTSPVKKVSTSTLSASLTNLKEDEPVRKPPVLRRVHTEVGTFSARGTKLTGSTETVKKPFSPRPNVPIKTLPNRRSKKDIPETAGRPTVLTNKSSVQSSNQKTTVQARLEKSFVTKRAEETVRKIVEKKKKTVDVKPVVNSNLRSVNTGKQITEKKIESKDEKANKKNSEIETISETVELEANVREDASLSEKELLLSGIQKEEELGSCEMNSEDEVEIELEEKKDRKKENGMDEEIGEDMDREKILEVEEEDEEEPENEFCNSDQLGEETEEELNTFEDNLIDWDEYRRQKIDQIHQMGLNWGEQMDMLDLEFRTPGRAPQMHEKLSSPFRKRSITETLRRHEEKLAKAQEQRERLLEEKAQRFKDIAKKAEEIKKGKEEQQELMRLSMRIKLQKAEEKRRMQLQKIVRKAHDEEEKVNEIAFINSLEAQNKRHDILSKEKDHELRLTEIQEERQRKQEEKAAKEAAAEERRKALEAERQTKLLEMQEKRKLRDQKIEQQLQEKEKERQELANQKARDREQRLNALSAAQQANVEELQKKIQQKQEESARRHEENIEQIRQKAFELSIRCYSSNNDEAPRLVPYDTKKFCTLCNVLIASEVYLLSHLRGKKHQEAVKDQHQGMEPSTEALELYNIKHIIDAPADQIDPTIALDKERQKVLKKRCKKIKQRLVTKGQEWEKQNSEKVSVSSSAFKQKFQKSIRDLQRHLSALSSSSWESNIVTSLERLLGECQRCLEKGVLQDKLLFHQLGGTAALLQMLQQILLRPVPETTPQVVPDKTLVRAAVVYRLACLNCPDNCTNTLLSNKVITLLDLVMNRLKDLVPDNCVHSDLVKSGGSSSTFPVDPVAGALLRVLSTALLCPTFGNETDLKTRVHDILGYTVSLGVVDKLSHYLGQVRGPLDTQTQVADFVVNVVTFLTALAATLQGSRYDKVFQCRKEDDTQLLATLQVTELAGTVSVLYGMLLHSGAPSRADNCTSPAMDTTSQALALATLRMLNRIALIDYQMLQGVLGGEGLSLQLRHIASYLLWFCSRGENPQLLHEVILLVGYFALLQPDNQVVLQSGQFPSVLQQLCSLPFQYFSDPALTDVLFPTLIACCFDSSGNRIILEQEMSPDLLANYIEACLLDIHQDSLAGRTGKKGDEQFRLSLSVRFPKSKWTAAKNFFQDRSAIA